MRRWNIASLLVVVVVAFFSLVSPALAGEPKSKPQLEQRPPAAPYNDQSFPTLKVTTSLVMLDVVATDGKGKPVTDLKAEDFTLLEDNTEQKISNFQLQQPGLAPAAAKAQLQLAPNNFTNVLRVQPAGPRNVIVFDDEIVFDKVACGGFAFDSAFDSVFDHLRAQQSCDSHLLDPMYARVQVIKFVKGMETNEPLAIFKMSNDGLYMLQDFTTDRALLLKAAKKINIMSRDSLLQFDPSGGLAGGEYRAGLEDFAKTLTTYPGRKNLIWISGWAPQEIVPYDWGFEPLLVSAAFDLVENQNGALTKKSARALVDSHTALYLVSPFFAQHALAASTGGKAFPWIHDLARGIRESIADGSTYYELGYYPTNHDWDGLFRQIKVKVNRPGIKLRYRPGYGAVDPESYARKPVEMLNWDMQRALDLGSPVETAITFYAQVTPPSAATENEVVVQYAIDAGSIEFVRGDDGLEHASVDCVAQAFTEEGVVLKGSSDTYGASLKPEVFKKVSQSGFPCMQKLDLPAGSYILKLAARDNHTGAMGTVNARVIVPKLPAPPASNFNS